MKYFPDAVLEGYSSAFTNVDLGDRVLDGSLAAYSCKQTPDDKKTARKVGRRLSKEFGPEENVNSSSREMPSTTKTRLSPLGPVCARSTRLRVIYMIEVLNLAFSDYSFEFDITPFDFRVHKDLQLVKADVETNVCQPLARLRRSVEGPVPSPAKVSRNGTDTLTPSQKAAATRSLQYGPAMWKAIDDIISLADCEIYSYVPPMDSELFVQGRVWSCNYFFYNESLKRFVFLQAGTTSKVLHGAATQPNSRAVTPSVAGRQNLPHMPSVLHMSPVFRSEEKEPLPSPGQPFSLHNTSGSPPPNAKPFGGGTPSRSSTNSVAGDGVRASILQSASADALPTKKRPRDDAANAADDSRRKKVVLVKSDASGAEEKGRGPRVVSAVDRIPSNESLLSRQSSESSGYGMQYDLDEFSD